MKVSGNELGEIGLICMFDLFTLGTQLEVTQEIRDVIPVPLRRVRTTRSSTHSHPFQV